jgi:rod shape-determining protein MreD
MIMPRGEALLLPANPLFIGFTLLLAFGFNLLPFGRVAAVPDLLAVVLVFWNVHQPRRVGVGVAFAFGLAMDVHEGALLGQHALAYTLLSYLAISIHRRLRWFGVGAQVLHVLPVFFAAHGVAAGAAGRRRHVPGLVGAAGAAVRGLAVAAGDAAVAGAAAAGARSGSKSAAVKTFQNLA